MNLNITDKRGVYAIVDMAKDKVFLLNQLRQIVAQNIIAVQLWQANIQPIDITLVNELCDLCHTKNIPVLVNNNWQLIPETHLDGVHFDEIPPNYLYIKEQIAKPFIAGVTCNNSLDVVKKANNLRFDYISFCSMFSSATSNSCELVTHETVKAARALTSMPVFLAGGIVPQNIELLHSLDYDGIAVVSGIMNVEYPAEAVQQYVQLINKTI